MHVTGVIVENEKKYRQADNLLHWAPPLTLETAIAVV